MSETRRFIPVKCLQIGNEFVPFWLLEYDNSEDYGEGFRKKDAKDYSSSRIQYGDLQDLLWDSKKCVIVSGITKDVYPDKQNCEFKIGETVLVEIKSNEYGLDKVVDIIFEEYDTNILRVKKMDEWDKKKFTEEELSNMKKDDVYEMRIWKPFYKLESGKIIKYSYQLKRFKQS
jgi:hypothetical protein